MSEKIYCYQEDEDILDYEEEYIEDEEDGGNDYYQGYDDDDYQNPDSEYEDE
ncbi:hypothetical protein [Helicobacter pametensis]|uniref:hypothetical protein n=1 Tax=Helicobacter pametensis TaxID=95149 RepID=UPI0004B019AB|nr:hypothetical protein [Helicobacter pametensis]